MVAVAVVTIIFSVLPSAPAPRSYFPDALRVPSLLQISLLHPTSTIQGASSNTINSNDFIPKYYVLLNVFRPFQLITSCFLKIPFRTSLVVQWLRICLPRQGTRVRALVREDLTCHGATKPVRHNYWARVPQLLKPTRLEPMLCNKEKPPQWEAHAPQWRVVPACRN